jgi:FkbM family methyltransferase
MIKALVTNMQRMLSGNPLALKCTVKLRNQCDAIIGRAHGATISNHERNGEAALLRQLRGSIRYFVDVGANRGSWSMMVAKTGPVEAGLLYEPGASALEVLRTQFVSWPQIEIVGAAVSDAPGEAQFFDEQDAGETSSLSLSAGHSHGKATTVRVATLDAEICGRGWDKIDFLKIDAEGYDYHVLRGASQLLKNGRVVAGQFEYGGSWKDAGSTLTAALRFLDAHGYRVYLLKNDGLHQPNVSYYGEYFGYSNYVFIRGGSEHLLRDMKMHSL